MRNLTLLVLISFFLSSGFSPSQLESNPTIIVLDRNGQPTTQIADGDTVQLQINFSQAVTQQRDIDFLFDDTTVGMCLVPSGDVSCKTGPFPALGWHWNIHGEPQDTAIIQASDGIVPLIAQSEPLTIKPRPVVMVHGFLSNPETWTLYQGSEGYLASLDLQGFAVGDGQVPGRLNTGDILNPAVRTNTIAQNAEILGQYIDGVKQMTGAQMVDLVGHSMGGMISRYYIDRVMQERDVAQLIMLGSPMGGSDCAVLPAALGFFLPASIEIREGYMTGIFNRQITHRRGIPFYDLGGTAINEAFKSPCTGIPNDTVVSFGSINAIPLESSQIDDIHSDLTISEDVFTEFVAPLLGRSVETFQEEPDPDLPARAESPLEFTRVYTGHVDAGGSSELTINIDPGLSVASFALYDVSRSITTIVRGASGNIIELTPEANGFIQVDDPSSLFYLGYGFQNPKPGPWRITVQSTEKTPPTGTDFAVSVYFVGGAKLDAKSSTLVPRINEQVRFDANLSLGGDALQITEAVAVIRDSDGNIQRVDFPTGQSVSAIWTPTQPGLYAIDIIVKGIAPDGSPIERTDFLAVEVQPNPSRGQVTLNLVVVITIVVLVVSLILFVIYRSVRGAVRKVRT